MRPVAMGYLPGTGLVHELLAAAVVCLAFVLVFALAELWHRRAAPPVEWSRKLIHVGGGIVAGFFPWLFSTHWTLLALCSGLVLLMRAARRGGWLPSLHGVTRSSKGEIYYPLGVYLLFVVARAQPVFYLMALSALVLSDTLAAVLGQRYGQLKFTAGDDLKSVEGSAAFFLFTFLGVHLPLLLLTHLPPAVTVLVGLQVALLVTSFEAISQQGNDNLVVPLATYYLLLRMTARPVEMIALQLGVQIAILLFTVMVARRTHFLTLAGAIAVHLVLYAAFSLGGAGWIVAPLLALGGCITLDRWFSRASGRARQGQQARAVFYVAIVSVALIFVDNTFSTLLPVSYLLSGGHPFFALFVGALAAQVAIMVYQLLRARSGGPLGSRVAPALLASGGAFGLVVPLGLLSGPDRLTLPATLVAAAICLASPPLYVVARRFIPRPPGPHWDFRFQALAVAVAVVAAIPFQLWWTTTR